ncbi:MAG: DNA recombination protein RmuC [Kiritimatiellia bacterium]
MEILFSVGLGVGLLLLVAVVVLLVTLLRRPKIELPESATPEALAQAENRIRAHLTEQLAALEMKSTQRLATLEGNEAQLAATQRKELQSSLAAMEEKLRNVDALSQGVASFSRLLGNVKTRGTWGEWQLGQLLEDMLAPGQFVRNVKPNPRSQKIVEFAIALPGTEEGTPVYLPMDAKFPKEEYERMVTCSKAGDEVGVERERSALMTSMRLFATQVKDYIAPPYTTNFAVLFVPTEGLYLEIMQDEATFADFRKKRILLAGPATIGAVIDALQAGFTTLAVQRRATEVWRLMSDVKAQLDKFVDACDAMDKKLAEATKATNEARSRVDLMRKRLQKVEIPEEEEHA